MPRIQTARASHVSHAPTHPYRIVVASAGEPASLGAIRVALALARRASASVHVVAVATPFLHVAAAAAAGDDMRRATVEAVGRQLATVAGTAHWEVDATVGMPADCIVDAAESWPASLIIVGIGEHGAAARLFGSETAVAIVKQSTIPVLAVPQDAHDLPTCAAAAIDFTEASIDAATLAATLLGPNGVLTLVHASMLIKSDPEPGSLPDVYTAGARDKLEELCAQIHRDAQRQVRSLVVNGDIAKALLSFVERERCDLLALGGHEQGLLDRVLFGSMRTTLLRRARCIVLVAPHPMAGASPD